jgi:inner membrane protein
MASVFSHPAVPIGAALALGSRLLPPRLLAAAMAASVIPDLDAIGFWIGIPYDHVLGHRGFTHSLVFAALLAAVAAAAHRFLRSGALAAFLIVFVSAASHGFFDAMTDGGLGVAFFSPFSNERYFFPWRVIPVSPIAVSGFWSWGPRIVEGELLPIWAPCLVLGAAGLIARRARTG